MAIATPSSEIGKVPVAGMIYTTHPEDTFATHDTNLGWGSFKIVENESDFADIPTERLRVGTIGIATSDLTKLYIYSGTNWDKMELNEEIDLSNYYTKDETDSEIVTAIIGKANTSDLGTAAFLSVGTLEGNIPTLNANGKIPDSMVPQIALADIFSVASESEMLALDAQQGDVAVRSDESKTFMLSQMPANVVENWVELKTPTEGVSSVNGMNGVVTIDAQSINAIPVTSINALNGVAGLDGSGKIAVLRLPTTTTVINNTTVVPTSAAVYTHTNSTTAHSATTVPTANRIAMYSTGGILNTNTPTTSGNATNKSYVDGHLANKANINDVYLNTETYNKVEVDGKIGNVITYIDEKQASAMEYKGSVASYENLPTTGNNKGDVWNVNDTGNNYAWDGSAWDSLGGTVDFSNIVTLTGTQTIDGIKAFTEKITGNIDTADRLKTARNISISGAGINTSTASFNGSGNVSVVLDVITQDQGDNSNNPATTAYVDTGLENKIDTSKIDAVPYGIPSLDYNGKIRTTNLPIVQAIESDSYTIPSSAVLAFHAQSGAVNGVHGATTNPNSSAGFDSIGKIPAYTGGMSGYGRLNTNTPTEDLNVTNKKYVDDALNLKVSKSDIGTASGYNVGTVSGTIPVLGSDNKIPSSLLPTTSGGVSSVNGKTGAVVLNASDVGAIATSQINAANGVPGLNSSSHVVISVLPTSSTITNTNTTVPLTSAVYTHTSSTTAHSATATPTGSRIAMYNANAILSSNTPTATGHVATKGYVDSALNTKANISNVYTKAEVDGKVVGLYKYKGSVDTIADLPSTNNTLGDVWDVKADGMNYAWSGTTWDSLGSIVDLSNIVTLDTTQEITGTKTFDDISTVTQAIDNNSTKVATTEYVDRVTVKGQETNAVPIFDFGIPVRRFPTTKVFCNNGTWFQFYQTPSGNSVAGLLTMSNDNFETFIEKKLGNYNLTGIAVYNNITIISAENNGTIYISKDNFNTWQEVQLSNISNSFGMVSCNSNDGAFAVTCGDGNNNSSGFIYVSTNGLTTWTTKEITEGRPYFITCYNNTWVVGIIDGSNTGKFITSNDNFATWTVKQIGNGQVFSAGYNNGLWTIGTYSSSNIGDLIVYLSSDNFETFTSKIVDTNIEYPQIRDIYYHSGLWFICGSNGIYVSEDNLETFTRKTIGIAATSSVYCYNNVYVADAETNTGFLIVSYDGFDSWYSTDDIIDYNGTSNKVAREDHSHKLLLYNGNPMPLGEVRPGSSHLPSSGDHVHPMPNITDLVGYDTLLQEIASLKTRITALENA